MLKFKTFFLILTGILLFSMASEARVCFLAGGTSAEDNAACLTSPQFESPICPGYSTCEVPELGASSCEDEGNFFYRPEDCCTGDPCDASAGRVCTGISCSGMNSSGVMQTMCEAGKCVCDSSYTEICSKADGLIGVGTPCDGKYKSCKCDSNYYYKCEGVASCQGASCSDDYDGEKCTSCVCPVADEQNWVSDSSACCNGVAETCINRPSGIAVYKCRTTSMPDCVCGYNNSTNGKCINGCTDRNYTYAGNIPAHVICSDFTSGITAACGNGCYCEPGYWDYFETCKKQPLSICQELGYTDTNCTGNFIGCPYDASAQKCLGAQDIPCSEGYTKGMECNIDNCQALVKDPANASCGKCEIANCGTEYCSKSKCQTANGVATICTTGSSVTAGSTSFQCYRPVVVPTPEATCPLGTFKNVNECGKVLLQSGDGQLNTSLVRSTLSADKIGSTDLAKPIQWELVNIDSNGCGTCQLKDSGIIAPDLNCTDGQVKDVSECKSDEALWNGSFYWELNPFSSLTKCGTCKLITCDDRWATTVEGCNRTLTIMLPPDFHWELSDTTVNGQCKKCIQAKDPIFELEDTCCKLNPSATTIWECTAQSYTPGQAALSTNCATSKPLDKAGFKPWVCNQYLCEKPVINEPFEPSVPEETPCCTPAQMDAINSGIPLNFDRCTICDNSNFNTTM